MKELKEPQTCYKGFDKNLCCRGFKYEVGQTYELEEGVVPKACEVGFHACPNPADLFAFYAPNDGNQGCICKQDDETMHIKADSYEAFLKAWKGE